MERNRFVMACSIWARWFSAAISFASLLVQNTAATTSPSVRTSTAAIGHTSRDVAGEAGRDVARGPKNMGTFGRRPVPTL